MDYFWLRFHALVKISSDYQRVTKHPVAASRRWTLTGAFWQWFGCAPAGVGPLEVRFAHPVRLSPDTHSQGHGRPCLQRLHPRRAFPATWFIFCDSFKMSIWYRINVLGGTKCLWQHSWSRLKRFPRTKHVSKALLYRLKRFRGTEFRFYTTGKRDRNKRHEREARSDV